MTHPAQWKVDVAGQGVRVDKSVREDPALFRPGTANGALRAVELVLPDALRVRAPLAEPSPFLLIAENGRFVLRRDGADAGVEVRVTPPPRFTERKTRRGTPMARIATVYGNHLVVSPGLACGFSVRGAPCRFCLEGARVAEHDAVGVEDVVDAVRAAFDEGVCDDVYFNSGVFDAEDGGVGFLAPYIDAVRRHFDTLIAVQVHPPRTNAWIDRTYAMGVDALSYNLEIYDQHVLERQCIGRARYVGRDRYLEALAYAARIFPSGTVWTDLVVGLEPVASTIAGIDALTATGVVPVAAIVRGDIAAPSAEDVTAVLAHLYRAVKGAGINMGWVRDLGLGVAPLEARWFAGDGARLAVTVQNLTRSRLGGFAARGLARVRRRLRVKKVQESFDSAHL